MSAILLLLPATLFLRHYRENDKHRDYSAYYHGLNLLNSLEERAIIFTKGDNNTFPLWYLQFVEGRRPDVVHFGYPLALSQPYVEENYPDVVFGEVAEAVQIAKDPQTNQIVSNNIGNRPIYFTGLELGDEDYLVPNGIVFKVEKEEVKIIEKKALEHHQRLWESYSLPGEGMLVESYSDIRGILASYFDRRGMQEEAVEEHKKALQLNPDSPHPHFRFGVYLYRKGRREEALNEYKKATEIDPNYARAYYNLGYHFYQEGKIDKALENYRKAVRADPNYAEAHYNLGLCLSEKGRLEEAISHYRRAIKLRPDYVEAYNNLGNAYIKKGWFKKAARQLEKALKLRPRFLEAHINLGVAYHGQGLGEKAIAEFERALELDPGNKVAEKNLEMVRGNI